MEKIILIIGLVLVVAAVALGYFLNPNPQPSTPPTVKQAPLTKTDCFQHYQFSSNYFENIRSEKISYNADENATFFFTIKNPYNIPISDVALRVQILFNGDDVQRDEGDDLIDEFFVVKNLNLLSGDSYSGEFNWKIPSMSKAGSYRANFFLISDYKLYLSGASFIAKVPGVSVSFLVKSSFDQFLHFDRANTFLNNQKFKYTGTLLNFSEGDTLSIKTDILNDGREKDVNVTWQVFEFDDMISSEEILSLSSSQTISLSELEKKTLSFTLPNVRANSYLIKIIAVSDETKSILKLKIPVLGDKGRFVYLSLSDFPITVGKNSGIMCLTNSGAEPGSTDSFNGTVKIQIYDKDRVLVSEREGDVEISGDVNGYSFDFDSTNTLSIATLVASIYDSNGNLHDKIEINYNSAKFLGVKKNLDVQVISVPTRQGENLVFKVNYKDVFGNPVNGKIVSLISDSSGKVVAVVKEKAITGLSEEKVSWTPLVKGSYKLKVIDQAAEIDITKDFSIN